MTCGTYLYIILSQLIEWIERPLCRASSCPRAVYSFSFSRRTDAYGGALWVKTVELLKCYVDVVAPRFARPDPPPLSLALFASLIDPKINL